MRILTMTQVSDKVNINNCWNIVNSIRRLMRELAEGKSLPPDVAEQIKQQINVLNMEL